MKLLFRDNFKRAPTAIGASWDDDAASSANPVVAATLADSADDTKTMRMANGSITGATRPNLVVMATTQLGVGPRLQGLGGCYQTITVDYPMTCHLGLCLINSTPVANPDGIWGGIDESGELITWTCQKRVLAGGAAEIFGGSAADVALLGGVPTSVRIGMGFRRAMGGGAHIWLDLNGRRLGDVVDVSYDDPALIGAMRPGISTDVHSGAGRIHEYALYGLRY